MTRAHGLGRLITEVDNAGGRKVTVYIGDYVDAQGRRHRRRLATNKADAQAALAKLVRDRDLELAGVQQRIDHVVRMQPLIEQYLQHVALRCTPATYDQRKELLEHWEQMTVGEVTPQLVEKFMSERAADGCSPATINKDLATIQACLNHAVRSDLIGRNPIARVRKLKLDGKQKQLPYALSDEQINKLLRAAAMLATPRFLTLQLLLQTGLRWGEAAALTIGDLQPQSTGYVINVRASTSKNGTSRSVPISDMLGLELLRQHPETAAASTALLREPEGGPLGLSHNFRAWLKKVADEACIPLKRADGRVFNVHALRHTFATRLARNGVSLQQASYLTGHKTVSVLAKVYTHLESADLRKVVDSLPQLGAKSAAPKPAAPAKSRRCLAKRGHARTYGGGR